MKKEIYDDVMQNFCDADMQIDNVIDALCLIFMLNPKYKVLDHCSKGLNNLIGVKDSLHKIHELIKEKAPD